MKPGCVSSPPGARRRLPASPGNVTCWASPFTISRQRARSHVYYKAGFDISVQSYKTECPPVALTKLPLTACPAVMDFVLRHMQHALETLERTAVQAAAQKDTI